MFLKKLMKKMKVATLALLLVPSLVMPNIAKATDGPRFNFLPDDDQMFTGLNISNNEEQWRDPVDGQAGDTLSGIIYYHNGVPGTVAENTKVSVDMPSQSTDGQLVLQSTVWADNASAVSDTVTYNFDQDVKVTFLPESVTWFKDYHDGDHSTPIIYGQTGEELITPNGLEVGDVNGCWDFIGFVRFQFRVDAFTSSSLSVEKLVRDVTWGESSFVKENTANQGDVLEYKVNFANNGNGAAEDVNLFDVLPANTQYISGTTILNIGDGEEIIPDGIVDSGVSLGILEPGMTGYVRFKVKIGSGVANNQVLINTAHLIFNKDDLCDTAKTTIVLGVKPTNPGGGLPVTGDETIYISILAGLTAVMFYVYKKKRLALLKAMK